MQDNPDADRSKEKVQRENKRLKENPALMFVLCVVQ